MSTELTVTISGESGTGKELIAAPFMIMEKEGMVLSSQLTWPLSRRS